jgi:hypothetical protein
MEGKIAVLLAGMVFFTAGVAGSLAAAGSVPQGLPWVRMATVDNWPYVQVGHRFYMHFDTVCPDANVDDNGYCIKRTSGRDGPTIRPTQRERLRVYRHGTLVGAYWTKWHNDAVGRVVWWRTPANYVGPYSWCVMAFDRAGHQSKPQCDHFKTEGAAPPVSIAPTRCAPYMGVVITPHKVGCSGAYDVYGTWRFGHDVYPWLCSPGLCTLLHSQGVYFTWRSK